MRSSKSLEGMRQNLRFLVGRYLFQLSVVKHVKPLPNLARPARGVSG